MKLRMVAPAATIALAALALLAGCKKGDANANSTNTKNTTVTSASPSGTGTMPTPLGTPTSTASASTPTEAFRLYYEAIKRQDGPAVKSLFSRATLKMLEDGAKRANKSLDDYFNDMFKEVSKDIPPTLPESRNEKINGDRATLEINDTKKGKWETLHFVKEGGWKISFDGEGRDGDTGGGTGGDTGGDGDGGDDDGGGGHDGGH